MNGARLKPDALIERESEQSTLHGVLDTVAQGSGRLVLLLAEAGLGKTALLAALAEQTRDRDFAVFSARGAELERDFAHGMVRQLFEAELRSSTPDRRRRLLHGGASTAVGPLGLGAGLPAADAAAAVLASNHGLHWLAAALAEERPLALLLDDVHWSDRASLLFAHYLARRLEGLSILVVLAWRPHEPGAESEILDQLRALQGALTIPLRPLTAQGTARLIRRLTDHVSDEVSGALHESAGGNPFLVHELVEAAAASGAALDRATAEQLRALAPASIAQGAASRLNRLPAEAARLAFATAVLDSDAELRHVLALAEVPVENADSLLAALTAARLFAKGRPLRFVHPVVRRALYDHWDEAHRGSAHLRAARVLDPENPDRAAVHLLRGPCHSDPWVVERLRAAATRALATGAPATAVALLRRALAEPPATTVRGAVLAETGRAELATGDACAVEHLEHAVADARSPAEHVARARDLARAYCVLGDSERGGAVLESAATALGASAREERLLVEAERQAIEALIDERAAEARARLEALLPSIEGTTAAERVLLAAACHNRALAGLGPVRQSVELAERAWGQRAELVTEVGSGATYWVGPVILCMFFDHADLAAGMLDAVDDHARRRGSLAGAATASVIRARLMLVRGRLRAAESLAATALEVAPDLGPTLLEHALGSAMYASMLQGRADEAHSLLGEHGRATGPLTAGGTSLTLLLTRAALHRERGEHTLALLDVEEALRREGVRGGVFPYPSLLGSPALTLHACGRRAEAVARARHEVAAARAHGVPGVTGTALVGLARVDAGDAVDLLTEAVALLAGSCRELDYAQALVDLGAALRRSNHRTAAREPLTHGMELAHRLGARPLAERARDELLSAGGRPRRFTTTGTESLTAAELRVARHAAAGMSNAEIAQTLFVTRKTVETHLGHVFAKLRISARSELADQLDASDGS